MIGLSWKSTETESVETAGMPISDTCTHAIAVNKGMGLVNAPITLVKVNLVYLCIRLTEQNN